MAVLGGLSLVFAALGIYGVMSFFVSTRVREFGIRLALGASPRAVLQHVFGEARLLLLVGLLSGVFLMAVVERVLDNRIVRMMPNAVEMWIAAIALVLITGLIATYFPARRASRTDPMVALREL
jgi:ABC-type antimicrobial peptide transport system permease subunit